MITLVVGNLKETSRIDNAKKEPLRVFVVRDRLFYLVSNASIDSIDWTKAVSHEDIDFLYIIKMTKNAATMVKGTVDQFLKIIKPT